METNTQLEVECAECGFAEPAASEEHAADLQIDHRISTGHTATIL